MDMRLGFEIVLSSMGAHGFLCCSKLTFGDLYLMGFDGFEGNLCWDLCNSCSVV